MSIKANLTKKESSKEITYISSYEDIKNDNINHFSNPFTYESHKLKLYDDIVEKIGYGKEQFYIIIVAGLCFMTQGFYFFLNSGFFIPIKNYYNVSNSSMSIASSMVYLSGAIVNLLMGYLTHYIGRTKLIKITLFITMIFHIVLSLSNSFFVFCVCLFIIGACVNLNGPLLTNILAEYLPVKFRAFTMGTIWGWYSIGSLYMLTIYLYVMPEYSIKKYILVMLIYSFLPLLTLLYGLGFLKNSPRSLILNQREGEGLEILSNMYKRTKEYKIMMRNKGYSMKEEVFSSEEKNQIIKELKDKNKLNMNQQVNSQVNYKDSNDNKNLSNQNENYEISNKSKSGMSSILSDKYKFLSILLFIIWIMNSLVGYGPFFILPLTLSDIQSEDNSKTESEIIKSQIFVTAIGLLANPIAGFLCELKYLGRIKTGFLSGIIGSIICLLLVYDFSPNSIVLYISILNICNTVIFNTTITYTSEVYPTYIRDYSSGVMNSFGNLSAMISQPLYIYLNSLGIKKPYIFTGIFSLITGICYIFLPFETRGMELDVDEVIIIEEKIGADEDVIINEQDQEEKRKVEGNK